MHLKLIFIKPAFSKPQLPHKQQQGKEIKQTIKPQVTPAKVFPQIKNNKITIDIKYQNKSAKQT